MANSARKRSNLEVEDVIEIRKSKLKSRELSKIYNTTEQNIYLIRHKKSWKTI